jgi:hypothetical protein
MHKYYSNSLFLWVKLLWVVEIKLFALFWILTFISEAVHWDLGGKFSRTAKKNSALTRTNTFNLKFFNISSNVDYDVLSTVTCGKVTIFTTLQYALHV